ncbi:MAG: hypothetical protein HY043_16850 [Verrucomicrobia bacterium]|nr:hypothetical protein [Verrucomicrobiota bacterium]
MNWLNLTVILITGWLIVFCQSALPVLSQLVGAQIDLLPALMVYASLACGVPGVLFLACVGGLGFDALSANPLGVSVASLFVVGMVIHWRRELILREERYAQHVLGAMAGATAPLITLFTLFCAGESPLVGWGTLWQFAVMTGSGAIITPIFFHLFAWFDRLLNHPVLPETSFRADREIKRGRQ